MRLFICKVPTPDGWIHLGLRDLGVRGHEQYDEKLFHLPDLAHYFVAIRAQVGTVIGAVVILVLVQTYCSFMTPWIALLFLIWLLGGSKLT